jgi:hypothetical protein
LLTASISPDLFTAPPPGNAISLIKEGFRDKSKHLSDRAPRGARRRARSRARIRARKRRVARRHACDGRRVAAAAPVATTHCLWTRNPLFERIFGP